VLMRRRYFFRVAVGFGYGVGEVRRARTKSVLLIFRHKAVPGSLQWRSFAEDEVRLALDAAASTLRVRP
jgi:hypothetical protein